jgi:hypothetical protein
MENVMSFEPNRHQPTRGRRRGASAGRREGLIDPYQVVQRIMLENKNASVEKVCDLVWEHASEDLRGLSDVAESFTRYLTRNLYAQIFAEERARAGFRDGWDKQKKLPQARISEEERKRHEAEHQKRTSSIAQKIKQITLMEMPTPYDKPLGDLNEAECLKLGSWYAAVGKGVGNKHVRTVKTEADLHAAFAKVAA